MSRRLSILVISILAVLAFTAPALAGGWAVITLDSLPQGLNAGQPISVGFTVRQHGRTPVNGLTPIIHLTNPENGETLAETARQEGQTGHYLVTFTLPSPGTWRWSIDAFNIPQPMPELSVSAPVTSSAAQREPIQNLTTGASPQALPVVIGVSGLLIAGLALLFALKRRSPWSLAAVLLGLMIGALGFARAGPITVSANTPEAKESVSEPATSPASAEQGAALFVAKGCLSCHRNDRVDKRFTVFSTEIGPNLTALKTSPEYLQLWLSDPARVWPKTEMPNLNLSPGEIEALIAFLLDQQDR